MNSLSRRIQVPANVISAVLLIGLAGWLLYRNIATQQRMVSEKATAMLTFLNKSAVTYLINFDLTALDGFAKQVVKDEDFVYVVFFDDKGKPLTDAPKVVAPGTFNLESEIVSPDHQKLGSIRLGYSLQRVRQHLSADVATCAGVVFLAQILMTIGLGFVTRSIQQALRGLADQMARNVSQNLSAARQISTASHGLTEGAGKQAESIEQTSSSLEQMSSVTKGNAENAQKANDLAKQTRTAADKGIADMQAMSAAMQDIKHSSDDIAKIIRAIDEIAFQTNILALNAAVEAARAGAAGMGFAVVAEEVRNLALRSAQAAKETAKKIESAIHNSARGVEISGKVSLTLNEMAEKVRQVDDLATEVASASSEQTKGIAQINQAVAQMDKVTQANATSAQESASAAAELNHQANDLQKSVDHLLALVGGAQTAAGASDEPSAHENPGFPPARFSPVARSKMGSAANARPVPADADF